MAEIILEPTVQSKVIPLSLRLNDTDTSLVSQLVTNRQFSTADTDAWFSFTLEGLAATTGTFDLTLINLQDKSVFNHTDKVFNTNPFYYKLDSGADELTNEIRHAGRWVGQLVVTLANGDSATRKFIFDIEGHILDGTYVQTILLEDYNALIASIESAKDELTQYNVDYAALLVDLAAAETARTATYNQLVADQQANIDAFDVALDTGIVAANLAEKLQDFETTNNSRLLAAEQQLADTRHEAESLSAYISTLEKAALDIPDEDLSAKLMISPKKTVLHTMQSGVVKTGPSGTLTNDTIDFISGTQSVVLTTDPVVTYVTARVDLGKSITLSDKYLVLIAKRALGSARVANIQLQLWGAAYENYGKWSAVYGGSLFSSIDKWNAITFQIPANVEFLSGVRYVDILVTRHGEDVGTAVIKFNELFAMPKPTKGYLTITLDGAYVEQFTDIKPILDVKGYKACIMQNFHRGLSTPGYGGYMTLDKLRFLEEEGWDVCTHTGVQIPTLNEVQLREMAINAKLWLLKNGFNIRKGGRFLCALQNVWSADGAKIVGEYFHFLRTGENTSTANVNINNQLPIFNPNGIIDMTSTTTYERTAEVVEHAALHKEWCVITWHQGTRANELSLAQMQDIINLADTLGLEVVTMSEMYDKILPTLI